MSIRTEDNRFFISQVKKWVKNWHNYASPDNKCTDTANKCVDELD
jgi:hypothetical protein